MDIEIGPRFTASVSVSGTTYIEIRPRFTARVSASGTTCIEIGPRLTANVVAGCERFIRYDGTQV